MLTTSLDPRKEGLVLKSKNVYLFSYEIKESPFYDTYLIPMNMQKGILISHYFKKKKIKLILPFENNVPKRSCGPLKIMRRTEKNFPTNTLTYGLLFFSPPRQDIDVRSSSFINEVSEELINIEL